MDSSDGVSIRTCVRSVIAIHETHRQSEKVRQVLYLSESRVPTYLPTDFLAYQMHMWRGP